jgi:phosphate butyryltransferase
MDPRVGVLSAVETVNPAIQSSIDAALLSKMADRGQICAGRSKVRWRWTMRWIWAARTKGLRFCRGREHSRRRLTGNMLAKQLAFISHAEGAGLVLGARVPVILNSRSDSPMSRLASCAVAAIHHFASPKT